MLDASAMKLVFSEAARLKFLTLKQIFFFLKIYFHNVIDYNDCAGL